MNTKTNPVEQGTVSAILTKAIDGPSQRFNQRELANQMGYEKPNIVSMMKRGESKVPLEKVPIIAKVLKLDPGHLFRMCVAEYTPALYEALHDIFGNNVSKNEMEFVRRLRHVTGNLDPEMTTDQAARLGELFRGD